MKSRRARRRDKRRASGAAPAQLPAKISAQLPARGAATARHINPARLAAYAMFATFAVFAYLACVNLDWAVFWDDEATTAFLARNWLEFGAPLVDDGRNVYSFHSGADIAADGTFRYPQVFTALQALSFAVFGEGETQARAISAAFSLAGMALFADVLRREFPRRHALVAVAFALAALSPMTIGYARSATYNGIVLFLNMALFWGYLRFCASKQARYAALMAAAAIGSFHAHYLSGMVFVTALAGMHLLFRRGHFDRRAWGIAMLAGAAYAAQAAWVYFGGYQAESFTLRPLVWSAGNISGTFLANLNMLNRNGALAWSIALWFVAWRAAAATRTWRAGGSAWRETRDDCALQYLAFVLIGVCALTLAGLQVGSGDVRYFSSFAPFAAAAGAAVVCQAWRLFRAAGIALAGVLLLTNAAGWPLLNSWQHGDKPGWTLPLLAAGYHHEYRDALFDALEHLRENVAPDDLLFTDHPNPSWLLWYFSDKTLLCCGLSRGAELPPAIDARARDYLFNEDVRRGARDPDWLLFHLPRPLPDEIEFRRGGPRYRRSGSFPDWHPSAQRAEPQWHLSFPNQNARFAPAEMPQFRMLLYRIARDA